MRLFILTSILTVFICSFSFAQLNLNETGSKLSKNEASEMLEYHNMARKELSIPPMIWNTSIAAYAQEWAEYLANKKGCDLIHRSGLNQKKLDYGENLFWGSSASSYKPIDAAKGWYSEKKDYRYQRVDYDNYAKTGHYTQMIWASSTEMGAGMAVCPSGEIIVVANYKEHGNIVGYYPY
jgi:pathogenesis-related protein 1